MASVAQIIHEREAEIMTAWLTEARAAASARGLSATALENVMALFLSALADQVDTGQVDANDQRRKRVNSHLSTRLRQGFDLVEILDEFAALGRCIAKMWQSLPADKRPSGEDVERLQLQIHVAMTQVTATFHQHMLEDEQSEKRYGRQLQQIASEALHDVNRPLRDRLSDLLQVVMEAMQARCAAFLVYNVSTGELELVACAGAQALEEYATALDPSSFAGEVAAHEVPTAIHDAAATQLEVPDELRRSGVRSVLGVRLPPRDDLLGVLYIGIAEARPFSGREVTRLESLGERLALHLENARLFDELHENIGALHVEKAFRERFVSLLAHDLRGPLSAARLAADLLAMELASRGDAPDMNDLASRTVRNIDRADRMIHDLLDANRIRAGEALPLRLERCDLHELVEQVVDDARTQYGDRFIINAAGPVHGMWSCNDLQRALWNLITNAVKYGAPTEPITISVVHVADIVRVSVHNSGPPIPLDEQPHIFDAYARASTAEASGRIGWGLGLTLVRGTAEAHGGRAFLTSDLESGTTFTLELPIDAQLARASTGGVASVH